MLLHVFNVAYQSWSNLLSVRWERHWENRRSADISCQNRKCFWKQCSAWIFSILLPEQADGEQLPLVIVVFITICILVYDYIKTQEEKLDYCVNYNRRTVCLAFPSSSHCYQNAIEEIRIYCELLQLFIFHQALQGKYLLFCQHLFDAIPRCTWWHSLAKMANTGQDFSGPQEAGSLPCLLAHLVLPVNEELRVTLAAICT